MVLVDHTGYVIDGDEILYILARDMKSQGELNGGIVGTLMTNMGLQLALEKLDIPLIRAKVGDRYVMEQLLEHGWKIGGENSGHIICLDQTTTGDGIVAALQVLKVVKRTNNTLFALRSEMTKLPQVLVNVRFKEGSDPVNEAVVQQAVQDVERKLAGKGRVLLRKSGTEPLIRVMVEGTNEHLVQTFADEIAEAVRNI